MLVPMLMLMLMFVPMPVLVFMLVLMLMFMPVAMALLLMMVMMVFVYHGCILFPGTKVRRPACNRVAKIVRNGYLALHKPSFVMRKQAVWCIPCTFFIVACVLNLVGCVQESALADTVKPALLPLLCATSLAYVLGRDIVDYRPVGLLAAAQLFGCLGDVLLIKDEFAFFTGGMAAFLIGHVCYMCLFGGQSWKGLNVWQWLLSLAVMGGVVFGLVKAIGIEGVLLGPMAVYGLALMLLIFSALAGVLRMPRGSRTTWWILLAGALLFTFSDACIAMGVFGVMDFALHHFVIMLTYLAAQSLLAVGGVRLALGK